MLLSESDITRQIRDVLNRCRIFHWKQWQGPMSQPKGVADILGYYKGRGLAIEVKKEGWTVPVSGTKVYAHYRRQKAFLNRVKENAGYAFFASSVEDVIREMGLEVQLYPLFNRCKGEADGRKQIQE